MITIDDRTGSVELHPLFPHGMSEVGRLQFGDMSWLGNGPDNTPWMVGVERKTIHDMVSCIKTGRFSGHQLTGLLNTYNTVYLVVEGMFRPNPKTGVLETWRRGGWSAMYHGKQPFLYSMVAGYLASVTNMCGVVVVRTSTDAETVHAVLALYHWWVDKAWEEHSAHQSFYTPPRKRTVRVKPPLVAKVASQLDDVEWVRAHRIADRYRSVVDFAHATREELMSIDGIGKVLADRIVKQLTGRDL